MPLLQPKATNQLLGSQRVQNPSEGRQVPNTLSVRQPLQFLILNSLVFTCAHWERRQALPSYRLQIINKLSKPIKTSEQIYTLSLLFIISCSRVRMRQKIESYKREIRKSQIQTYFNSVRSGLQNSSQQREISLIINQPAQKRLRVICFDQSETSMDNLVSTNSEISISNHWDYAQNHILRLIQEKNFSSLVQTLKDLYRELKKITIPNRSNLAWQRKEELLSSFFNKTILANVVSCVIKAFSLRLNGGLLQGLSVQAVSIVSLCIEVAPSKFDEELYLNSNLLLFLRYCIEEPKHDYKNLSRVIGIITQMILTSNSPTNRLFSILNDRKSPFHFGAIFYNISKMPLRTDDALTEHLINMLSHYLRRVEDQILKAKNDNVPVAPQDLTCLTLSELEIVLEIAVNAVNNLVGVCISNSEKEDYLEEALDVFRIIIQYFEVKENYKNKLNYRKFLQILSTKGFREEMKTDVLVIIDHLIYKDTEGYFTETLIKEWELLSILWPNRDAFPTYVLNIMCNLALDPKLKPFLDKYVHDIYLNLNLNIDSNPKMLYDFIYNWFSSQNFEILTSSDKLMVMILRDSEQKNPKIAQLQCAFWYNLARCNEVQIPQRILHYDFPIVRRIKEEILSLHDNL